MIPPGYSTTRRLFLRNTACLRWTAQFFLPESHNNLDKMNRLLIVLLLPCHWSLAQQEQLIKYVNPMMGTDRMGHTYPGATVPFGSVQLSPETDTLPYEADGHYNKDVY